MRDGRVTSTEGRINVKGGFSGVVVYRRRIFEDPVLTVYYLEGEPVYAESFLIKRRWWEGLLSEEEAESHLFGDAFGYAFGRYGSRYVKHIKDYTRKTITLTEKIVRDFGWDLEAETMEYPSEEVSSMFHVPYGEKESPEGEEIRRRLVSELNALGFPVFYVSGSREDPYGFFHTVQPVRGVMDRVTQIVDRTVGSVAFVLPLYIVARFDLERGRVWVVTKDVRKLVFSLRYLKPAGGISEDVLTDLADIRCCRYVIWRSGENTFSVFDGSGVLTLGIDEMTKTVERYLNEYDRILAVALSNIPSNVPPKMRRMLLHQIVLRNPSVEGFVEDFTSRFGVPLEYDKGEG